MKGLSFEQPYPTAIARLGCRFARRSWRPDTGDDRLRHGDWIALLGMHVPSPGHDPNHTANHHAAVADWAEEFGVFNISALRGVFALARYSATLTGYSSDYDHLRGRDSYWYDYTNQGATGHYRIEFDRLILLPNAIPMMGMSQSGDLWEVPEYVLKDVYGMLLPMTESGTPSSHANSFLSWWHEKYPSEFTRAMIASHGGAVSNASDGTIEPRNFYAGYTFQRGSEKAKSLTRNVTVGLPRGSTDAQYLQELCRICDANPDSCEDANLADDVFFDSQLMPSQPVAPTKAVAFPAGYMVPGISPGEGDVVLLREIRIAIPVAATVAEGHAILRDFLANRPDAFRPATHFRGPWPSLNIEKSDRVKQRGGGVVPPAAPSPKKLVLPPEQGRRKLMRADEPEGDE